MDLGLPLIIIANVVFSYLGLKDSNFFERFELSVERLRVYRDYKRLITSGFLHVGWWHLAFNMLSLFFFGPAIEFNFGNGIFFLIYFFSLIAGNLFEAFVHRNDYGYASVGASGAVSGIIFAVIAITPGMRIGFFFLPVSIPAWIYGLAFILLSIYGIRSRRDNVGHEAHLAGAVAGLLLAVLIDPDALSRNPLALAATGIPAIAFMVVVIARPHLLLLDKPFRKPRRTYTVEDRYNTGKRDEQAEVDRILEKIHKRGIHSLSAGEKELLDRYSRATR